MASVVVDNPSKALERLKDSQYVESEYDESAYGSECGSNIELQNSVEETQENLEKNAQKLKYLEKSNGILRNLYTALKVENVELKKGNDALEILNEQKHDALENHIVLLKKEKDALGKLNVALEKQNDTLANQLVWEKK